MIRIHVTSPFQYQYFQGEEKDGKPVKDHYLAAGNYYHLDPVKDKEEIKYVLSPNFVFKHYIYVNQETIRPELKKELNLEAGFYQDIQLPKEEEYIPTLIQDNKFVDASENYQPSYEVLDEKEQLTTVEPTPNSFDQTTKPSIKEEKKEVVEEKEETEELFISNVKREERLEELNNLHYSKVKEIAELYNLEYSTKKEVIQLILELEFGNPDAEFSKNIEVTI